MVYILEQRLQAQKIPENKGQKVLNDVVRTMYYPRFIEELFKPQEMYSIHSTRQIFDRLAHSSIMRLNENSMDKLFDLMAMGFKFQIISCGTPQEMVDVTLNHLNALKRLVVSNPQLLELLEECTKQIHVGYSNMLLADFAAMRQSLCTFFQDRKVKVSLFLHDHTQNHHDGSIVVSSSGTLQAGAQVTGTVRYFQGGAEVQRQQLPCVTASSWVPSSGTRSALGANLYEKDRNGSGADGQAAAGAPQTMPAAPAAPAPPAPPAPPQQDSRTQAAVGELKLLASLIGTAPAPSSDTFKLESLFATGVYHQDGSGQQSGPEIIQIDGTAPSDHHRGLDDIRRQMDNLTLQPQPDMTGQDDLLDLIPGS